MFATEFMYVLESLYKIITVKSSFIGFCAKNVCVEVSKRGNTKSWTAFLVFIVGILQ